MRERARSSAAPLADGPTAYSPVSIGPIPRGSPLTSASRSSRAICRSPSSRTGSSPASGAISRRIRLRTWSAKWGVTGPASARMSSTLTWCEGAIRSGRSASLIRCSGGGSISWVRLPLGGARLRAGGRLDLGQLERVVDLRLEADAEIAAVPDQPRVVVEGASRVVEVPGLDVEQEAPQLGGNRVGVLGQQQRTPLTARGERRRGGGVERLVRVRDHQAMARIG